MVVVMAYVRVASGSGGLSHQGTFSEAGASVVEGSPSTHPNFPCGQVHTNVWYFSASAPFMGNQELAYDGRLQFQRLAPSHAGEVRNARGSVVLEGGPEGNSMKISYALAGFNAPSSGSWTRYSVILRYAAACGRGRVCGCCRVLTVPRIVCVWVCGTQGRPRVGARAIQCSGQHGRDARGAA